MVHRYIVMLSVLLAGLVTQGCFNPEKEYENVTSERDTLAQELEAANRENEILTQALDNIKKEQERLQLLLNKAQRQQADAASANTQSTPPPPPLAGGSPTMNWGGYEWNLPPDAPSNVANTPAPPTAAASQPSGRTYQPKSGDVLSSIAARHNTTVERLVELNPYLARRRNYMIHVTDTIVLP